MNICLLTDNQKSDVFTNGQERYTKEDLLDLSFLATAQRTLAKTILSCCLDTKNDLDNHDLVDLMNVMTWLSEPLAAFFLDAGLWDKDLETEETQDKENTPANEQAGKHRSL
jgi:hypothetical protein